MGAGGACETRGIQLNTCAPLLELGSGGRGRRDEVGFVAVFPEAPRAVASGERSGPRVGIPMLVVGDRPPLRTSGNDETTTNVG